MDVNKFYSFTLDDRMNLVNQNAEYMSSIHFYAHFILLYSYEKSFVEVYYNYSYNKIVEVEILDAKDERLKLYATNVNISDLFIKDKA